MSKAAGRAFTLVELMVIIAIISILAAILTPVFSQARSRSRQTVCVSNQRQLGLAMMLYAEDNDDALPNGTNINQSGRMWPGEGWAGQCLVYNRSANLYHCPSDATPPVGQQSIISFGYNYNLVAADPYEDETDPMPSGLILAQLTSPSRTVMLYEVSGVTVNLCDAHEGGSSGKAGSYFSASGNGLDNRLYAHRDWSTGIDNTYATGYLGGRLPYDAMATQFSSPFGRHSEGSTFLLSDGHVKWMRGSSVSSGLSALGETCLQDNSGNQPGCGGQYYAAGTAVYGGIAATFSAQ